MSNNTYRNLPNKKVPDQYYTTTNGLSADIKNWPRTLTSVDNTAVEDIFADAVWRIDALDHQNEGAPAKILRNLGSAGPVLNCRSGSTSIADTNDPKFLDWYSTNYVYLPGVSGNYLSVPDANDLDITDDLDLRVRVALDDWTPSTNSILIAKSATSSTVSFRFTVLTTGILRFTISTDGTALSTTDSTVATGINDGEIKWIRVTRAKTAGEVKFFTSDDGVNWTQLGTTKTGFTTSSIFSSTSPVEIGSITAGTSTFATGKFYRAQILDGIDGTTVLDVDTSVITSGGATSFTAGTGQTVTINRSTSGRKTVAVTTPCWLFGTDDQILVPNSTTGSKAVDFGPNDSFTALVIMRRWATQPSNRGILSKYTGPGGLTGPGYIIFSGSTSQAIGFSYEDVRDNGVSNTSTFVNGDVSLVGGIVNRKNNFASIIGREPVFDTIITRINDRAEIVNQGVLTVGARGSGNNHYDMEFIAAGIWRRALSRDEITALQTYYLNRWK